jgi:hypothetical protein
MSAPPVEAVAPATESASPTSLRFATWLLWGVAIVVLLLGLFVAIVLPYGDYDALAVGMWSRLIAEDWPSIHFAGVPAGYLQRPLFYVLQGLVWHLFGFHIALGRVLSFFFSLVLVGSVAWLARLTAASYRWLASALAVVVLILVTYFDQLIAAGLSDVPMAAMVALTAAVASTRRLGRLRLPLLVLVAAAAILTKRSAGPALAGLGLAILIGPRVGLRQRATTLAALVVGVGLGLVYDLEEAHHFHESLYAFLVGGSSEGSGGVSSTAGTAATGSLGNGGNSGLYYANLAKSVRKTVLLDGGWLGADLRLFLWFAVAYAVARIARASHRISVVVALAVGAGWAWLGPHLAGAQGLRVGILGTGGTTEQIALLVLAGSLLFALDSPRDAIPDRLKLARLLVWAVPSVLAWENQGIYSIRLLSPAWPPLVLLIVWTMLPAFAGALRRSEWLVAIPTVAILALTSLAAYNLNGLGTTGWQQLRAGGISSWSNADAMRGIGLGGDFAAEVDALAPQVGQHDKILTTDSRLQFYYLDQIDLQNPLSCSQLPGHRIFVLLEDDELVALYGKRATSAFWEACKNVKLTKVAERPGAFAIFVNGTPRTSQGGCGGSPPQDQGLAIEFGRTKTAAAANALQKHIAAFGFSEARVEQLGCLLYRVVETGVPTKAVGQSIIAEAKSAGLAVKLVNGTGG